MRVSCAESPGYTEYITKNTQINTHIGPIERHAHTEYIHITLSASWHALSWLETPQGHLDVQCLVKILSSYIFNSCVSVSLATISLSSCLHIFTIIVTITTINALNIGIAEQDQWYHQGHQVTWRIYNDMNVSLYSTITHVIAVWRFSFFLFNGF